ncbi:phage tail protein [Methylohalobius crimeensis]|uniref:phage tail protein n=1 Tax=Methylohalobius crimeensis TaxID=244365 RepID=UPI0003B7848E|nr:tail fiber protein [Methylohalobius crimeensis]
MADLYIGEVRMFGGNYAPRNWALCNGQLMHIDQQTMLFSIISNMYGGDGRTTFAVPNLMGRTPMHPGQGPGLTRRHLAQPLGSDRVTVTGDQLPSHRHNLKAKNATAQSADPANDATLAKPIKDRGLPPTRPTQGFKPDPAATSSMSPQATGNAGSSQAHYNRQPFLAVNFIICVVGDYPPRS